MFKHLIVNPRKGGIKPLSDFVFLKKLESALSFFDCSDEELKRSELLKNSWQLLLSWILLVLLALFEIPLKYIGYMVEFYLNLLSQNGGFFGVIKKILLVKLKIPERGTKDFLSTVGLLDPRIDLYSSGSLINIVEEEVAEGVNANFGNRYLMDLCAMVAKLAYENAKVVENVVNKHWKMHFEGFFDCWNEKLKASNTQVFMFTDKPVDAKLIVISFRGTEPFNAQDWMTDVDFSWFEVPKVGKLHIGFLEAMGLGNRSDVSTFKTQLKKKERDFFSINAESEIKELDMTEKSAYYKVATKLADLLNRHKNAKFVVTGHSLGGALAIMFPTVLVIQDEVEIMKRLRNVYTFGQPRIGDEMLGTYMESHLNLNSHVTKYVRVVYSYDVVPRVPFDDKIFLFKHFGQCLYYDNRYFGQFTTEEPNPNYFDWKYTIPMHLTAIWDVYKSFAAPLIYGAEYKETWLSKSFRLMGIVLPGVASHSPVDYVNSVRLGWGD